MRLLAEADLRLEAEVQDLVPERLRAGAALGQLANPIVSFNVEWLSSVLLARPCGPFRLAFHRPSYRWREASSRFQRLVYHPHGLADSTTVMTATEYAAHEQWLAFGVAIHSAFENQLAIVGMSLEDDYLRSQIEQFRENIREIYWFNDDFSARLSDWAERHAITTVRADQPSF